VNIKAALTVPGWMDQHCLEWLAKKAATRTRIVEVGCWMGRSTAALAENTSGVVFAVDTWLGSEEHQSEINAHAPDWLYREFLKNMQPYINNLKVAPIRMSSTDAARTLSGEQFDMVFIDASHDYESVKADIIAWLPLIRLGGIICGHDRNHPPVYRAVHEAFPERVEEETDIWFVQV
jgi:predicted O-methyltransferase YrrM